MPLIFATDGPTLLDFSYADIVGVQYEFPVRYAQLVSSGETFLYYRGSRGQKHGGTGYFGAGVVGDIRDSTTVGRLVADVHDVELFAGVVPVKDADGNYFETGSTTGTNWANGVRRVPFSALAAITGVAVTDQRPAAAAPGFADPAHASAMERYSVAVVLNQLKEEFPAAAVHEMPPGNPGFDIEVLLANGALHVEVKGTILPTPTFHLSEGQRAHAVALGDSFRLLVVYQIDLGSQTHRLQSCSGGQLMERASLRPESYSGTLSDP